MTRGSVNLPRTITQIQNITSLLSKPHVKFQPTPAFKLTEEISFIQAIHVIQLVVDSGIKTTAVFTRVIQVPRKVRLCHSQVYR